MTTNPTPHRRGAALVALICAVAGAGLIAVEAVRQWPNGLIVLALLAGAVVCGWLGLVRQGATRPLLWGLAALLALAALAIAWTDGSRLGLAGAALLAVGTVAARRVYAVHAHLPAAPAPKRPVVVWNPKSGGGKAVRDHLADEARARGIEPIELKPGDDLFALVRDAVARGADGLAAAGGDGTQAIVASIAAEHDLPFACIPAGTRNHFALDLGVDRDDVVGALDAFVNGGEKRVDLATVNGRTFVNNTSLGLYAESVQQEGYRDAKIRTILATAPAVLGRGAESAQPEAAPGAAPAALRWSGPDGAAHSSAAVILVSNNAYRLGHAVGAGTRPRLDSGELGVAVLGASTAGGRAPLVQWSAAEFTVESDGDVPVGVDGEALVMAAPLVFQVRPGALRVRIAPQHPGASPSSAMPSGAVESLRGLVRAALGPASTRPVQPPA